MRKIRIKKEENAFAKFFRPSGTTAERWISDNKISENEKCLLKQSCSKYKFSDDEVEKLLELLERTGKETEDV